MENKRRGAGNIQAVNDIYARAAGLTDPPKVENPVEEPGAIPDKDHQGDPKKEGQLVDADGKTAEERGETTEHDGVDAESEGLQEVQLDGVDANPEPAKKAAAKKAAAKKAAAKKTAKKS